MFWKCLCKTVSPYFGKTKLNEGNSLTIWIVISNRIKYWSINCWAGLNLPTLAFLGEEDSSISFPAGMTNSSQSLASCYRLRCFFCLFVFVFFKLFIYLFLAVLGLRFCARAFSSCGKWGPLFIAVRGPLTVTASLVAEHRLQTRRLSNCGSRA